jgi:hypothetical protein
MQINAQKAAAVRRGSVLVTAVIVTMLIGTIALLTMTVSTRHEQEGEAASRALNSFYAAEAGLSAAWVELQNGGDGMLGSEEDPERLGGLAYWVEANEVEDDVIALVATGTDGHRTSRSELIVRDESGDIGDFGLFGESGLTLRSNSEVDSFDSTLGTYASQVSGGHAKENGNVGSNDDISVSANANVWGYAQYGPDADDSISVAANVGLSDGYGAAQTAIALPPIVPPSYASSGALTVAANQTKTIGPGDLQYTTLTTNSNSSLTVKGPCNLVISSAATIKSNSSWNFDATGGPIQVYALGSFELKSNSTVATTLQDPTQLTFYLSGAHGSAGDTTPKIDFSSNSQFYGTVQAPDLSVVIASNFELFGSLKAQWIEVSSNAKVHFDESLAAGALDAGSGFEVVAWRALEGSAAASGSGP